MHGVDVFCERCGTLQPRPEASTPRSAGVLARRVLDAVGITEAQPRPVYDWLRLCLNCRGYSCPACWNEADSMCQTCAPLPEPIYVAPPEPVYVAPPEPEPVLVAEPEPEPVVVVEPETQPEPVVEPAPEPAARPALPRMPVLSLPPARPHNAPVIPLPMLPAYPVAPLIALNEQVSATASMANATPVYELHSLLAPPPDTSHAISAGLRPCRSCQLSLSARAQFCRRCGSAQPN